MTQVSQVKVQQYLSVIGKSESKQEQGVALEKLMISLLRKIPGITVTKRSEKNKFQDDEVDIVCWNDRHKNGLYFLPNILTIGAFHWLEPVSSTQIKSLLNIIKKRGLSFGVLVAINGLTEEQEERAGARDLILSALSDERQIVILRGSDFEKLSSSNQLVRLFKEKLCELAVA
ncbi:MAG: restriction endonuclease [Candidatus Marinimicrobia bacterium]|nr:restriction endonuclease [Candidatus Neomarinimicrobiota bacterium]